MLMLKYLTYKMSSQLKPLFMKAPLVAENPQTSSLIPLFADE